MEGRLRLSYCGTQKDITEGIERIKWALDPNAPNELFLGERKILVDCGLFQGVKSVQRRNWDPLSVDVKEIDAVVLTHAHLDHSGYLPALVKQGFHKEIYGTRYTNDITKIILRDSARLQEDDAKYAAKKGYSSHKDPRALYDLEDAEKAIDHLRERPFRTREQIAPDAFVTFYPSGHILGSSFVVLEVAGAGAGEPGRAALHQRSWSQQPPSSF